MIRHVSPRIPKADSRNGVKLSTWASAAPSPMAHLGFRTTLVASTSRVAIVSVKAFGESGPQVKAGSGRRHAGRGQRECRTSGPRLDLWLILETELPFVSCEASCVVRPLFGGEIAPLICKEGQKTEKRRNAAQNFGKSRRGKVRGGAPQFDRLC